MGSLGRRLERLEGHSTPPEDPARAARREGAAERGAVAKGEGRGPF